MARARTYTYSPAHRALEIVAIVSFFALVSLIAVRAGEAVTTWYGIALLGAALLTGYLFADFASGVVHWAGDTVGDESWPLVGRNFIHHFRFHHVDPKDITRHDFIETNGNNSIISIPLLAILAFVEPKGEGWGLFLVASLTLALLFVFCTNQFHKWAHDDNPPAVAKVLQRLGLILRKDHHDKHHAPPHDKYYCITVGWLNPLLTKIKFFRGLEWLIARVRPQWLHLAERSTPVATA